MILIRRYAARRRITPPQPRLLRDILPLAFSISVSFLRYRIFAFLRCRQTYAITFIDAIFATMLRYRCHATPITIYFDYAAFHTFSYFAYAVTLPFAFHIAFFFFFSRRRAIIFAPPPHSELILSLCFRRYAGC